MDLQWQEVNTEHIVKDEWIDFRKSVYRFPDGAEIGPFYTYSRRDYVVIVALDENGRYICVRQFRQGIREVTTEFPAGGLERTDGRQYRDSAAGSSACCDPGTDSSPDNAVENALEAAKRELLEETGYISEKWAHLITIPSNATISDNYAHVYLAENCRKIASQTLDDTEFLNVVLHSEEDIGKMIRFGRFQQSVHVMAWLLAKERRSSAPAL
ncbi:MAG: NUDIX hydrolase [Lachnospiraceae bacterium]|nr:NUDIX hydrolase [Lachnospiraceae bacterium]